jgi:hypothetical protein
MSEGSRPKSTELSRRQLVRVLPDWDFGSMEVNALFVSEKTINLPQRAPVSTSP